MADPKLNINDALQTAKVVKQTFSRNSLTRMAKDSIFQFPMIMSANIPTEDAVVIARAYEAYYAALMVSVISMNSDFQRERFANAADYLRTFHQNNDIPNLFLSANSETATLEATTIHGYEKYIPEDVIMECWNSPADVFNTERLNSMYTPTTNAQRALEAYAEQIRMMHIPAMEADSSGYELVQDSTGKVIGGYSRATGEFNPNLTKEDFMAKNAGKSSDSQDPTVQYLLSPKGRNRMNDGRPIGSPTGSSRSTTVIKDGVPIYYSDGTPVTKKDRHGKDVPVTVQVKTIEREDKSARVTGQQAIVRNQSLTALEPTLINLQLTSSDKGGPIITNNIVIGIKAMIHQVNTDLMVSNLIDGCNDAQGIFTKFINWSEGTMRFVRDLIFGVRDAKENARADKFAQKWIRTLQRRKTSNMISKIGGGEVLPNTTIGTTTEEVSRVAAACGVDLSEAYSALRFLSQYYLLGFFIYDFNTGSIDVIFDGDTKFSTTSVRNMKSKTSKDLDITSFLEVMKIMGR